MPLPSQSKRDEAMFPGGGYNDRDGLWHYDHRTVGEYRRDAIGLLLAVFIGTPVLIGVVLAVLVWWL